VTILNGWNDVVVVCPFVSCQCVHMCPGCSYFLLKGSIDLFKAKKGEFCLERLCASIYMFASQKRVMRGQMAESDSNGAISGIVKKERLVPVPNCSWVSM
jgi:hypothetical protein